MRLALALVTTALVAGPAFAEAPFPFEVGGTFELVDQSGNARSQKDPDGNAQLLFFGYANCPSICSAALPTMAQVVDELGSTGLDVTPVMITIAPEQDRIDTIGGPLEKIHPRFIGLTGNPQSLQAAYNAFSIEFEPLFEDPEYGWIYAHGSFIYVLDSDGAVLALLPPTISADQAAGVVRTHVVP